MGKGKRRDAAKVLASATAAVLGLTLSPPRASAQVSYTGAGYSQNFDSLPNTPENTSLGTTPTGGWTDNNASPGGGQYSLLGWYLFHPINLGIGGEGGVSGNQRLRVNNGSANTGAFYSYGVSTSTDRALGMLNSNAISTAGASSYIGLRLINNTGLTLTQFKLSYIGEQWRDGGAAAPAAQTDTFAYSLDPAATISSGTYTNVSSLDFTSPTFTNTGAGAAIDGNNSANRTVKSGTITGINWAPGTDLWLRWTDLNNTGNDHGLAIDDLGFSVFDNNWIGADGTFSAAALAWSGGVPVAGQSLSFPAPFSGTVSVNAALTAASLNFADNYTLTDFGGSVNLSSGGGIAVATGKTVQIDVPITAGAIVKSGAGTLKLTAASTYTGTTTIDGGMLNLTGSNASSSIVVNNGGTLLVSLFNGWAGHNLTVNAGGVATTADGVNNDVQNITLAGGTVASGVPDMTYGSWYLLGDITATGGVTSTISAQRFSIFTGNHNITVDAGSTLNVTGFFRGPGGLTKRGSGTLIFAGASIYTGGYTSIDEGTLVGTNNSAFSTSTVYVGNGTTTAVAATLVLGSPTGGTSVANEIQVNPGDGTNRTIGGTNTSGTNTFTGLIKMDGTFGENRSTNFTAAAGGSVLFANIISGSGQSFNKVGGGTVILAGNNTYTGSTTVSGGTLQIGNGGTSGSITGDVTNNAALTFNRSDNTTFGGAISGSGSVSKVGSAVLTLTAANTYAGGTILSAGTLVLGNANPIGSGTLTIADTTTLAATNAPQFIALANAVSLPSGTATTHIPFAGGNDLKFDGVVSGSGALRITSDSPGRWVWLAAANGFSGGITLDGTSSTLPGLRISNSSAMGTGTLTSTITAADGGAASGRLTIEADSLNIANAMAINSGARLTVNNQSFTTTFGGAISGGGKLEKLGTGTLILAGTNTYSGLTTISSGTLQIGNGGTTGSFSTSSTIINNGNLAFNRSNDLVQGTGFSGSAISGTGSLTKLGAGTLTLNTANTYTGSTTISAGTLQLGNGGTTGSLSTSSTITNNGNFAINRSNDVTQGADFSGAAISGSGNLTKLGSGKLTLNAANSYTGGTTFAGGIVNAGSADALGSTGDLTFTGGTLQYSAANQTDYSSRIANSSAPISIDTNSQNVTFFSTLAASNSGGLTKLGSGTLTLTAMSSIGGDIITDGGTLSISSGGSISNGNGIIGSVGGANGTVNVQASGALNNSGALSVGHFGTGLLNITGGLVSDQIGIIGTGAGSSGTAVVTNGTWTNASGLSVGSFGIGTLNIQSGGVVTAPDYVEIGGSSGAFGFVNLNGGTLVTSLVTKGITGSAAFDFNGGTLRASATTSNLLVNLTPTINAGGATIDTNGFDVRTASPLLHNPSLGSSADGGLTKAGAGTLTLDAPIGGNTYTGLTRVTGGTLALGFGSTITGDVQVDSGATLLHTLNETASDNSTFTVDGTWDLAGHYETFRRLSGAGQIINMGGITLVGSNFFRTFSGPMSGAGGLVMNGVGSTQVLVGNNTYTGGTTITAGTLQIGNGNLNGSVVGDITNNAALVFNRSTDNTYAGVISGSGTVTQAGTGTLVLTGNSTHAGGTTISAGMLQLGDGGSSGSVTGNITNNAALAFNRSDSTAYGGVISGSGTVTKLGVGTLMLTGNNTYAGSTIINAGTLSIGNGGGSGAVIGNITNNAALVFFRSGNTTYPSVISGNGTVATLGGGTITLTGNNTYTGVTSINSSMLQLGNGGTSGSLSPSSTIVINNGDFAINRSDNVTQGSQFSGNAIAGTGNLLKLGAGTLTLTANNTYTGVTTVAQGTLQMPWGTDAGSVAGNIVNQGVVSFGPLSASPVYPGVISGSGSVEKWWSGSMTLTGNNTYTGGTTVGFGTLQIGNGGTSGSVIGDITISSNLATLGFNRSDDLTYGGVISGTGSVNKSGAGTLTLAGSNAYTGQTSINAGTLQLGNGGTSGSLSSSSAIVNNGDLAINRSDNVTQGTHFSAISGTGSLTKLGAGTLILTAANTYTGGTTINAGTLQAGATNVLPGSGAVTLANTAGAVLDLTGNNQTIGQLSGGGASGGNVTLGAGNLFVNQSTSSTYSGVIAGSGALIKQGTGTVTLNGNNSFTGGLVISGGAVAVSADSALGATGGWVTLSGGTLRFHAPVVLGSARTVSLIGAGGTFDTNGFDGVLLSPITGAGNLTKSGSGNLTVFNAFYNGLTNINGGKLSVSGLLSSESLANSGQLASTGATIVFAFTSLNASGAKISLIDSTLTLGSGVNKLNNSGQINLINSTVNGDIQSNAGGVINSAGDVTFNGSISGSLGALQVGSGTTTLAPGGAKMAAVANASITGKLDLTDNKMILSADAIGAWNGSNYTGVTGQIKSGRNGGAWNGNGIVTTMSDAAPASMLTTLAVATAAEVRPGAQTFAGIDPADSDVLVMYTYDGDADLSGSITGDDYFRIDSGFTGALTGYVNGDFNYDGKINADDYFLIDRNYSRQGSAFASAPTLAEGVSTVPEPGAVALIGVTALSMLRRRRARFADRR